MPKDIVLFVCIENTFRSILSEALFNAQAPKGWMAETAGVRAAKQVTPVVFDLLREIGIDLEPKTPRLVTQEMLDRADWIITFGCLNQCPARAKCRFEDWAIPGSTNRTMPELRHIRNDLRRRVGELIDQIKEG